MSSQERYRRREFRDRGAYIIYFPDYGELPRERRSACVYISPIQSRLVLSRVREPLDLPISATRRCSHDLIIDHVEVGAGESEMEKEKKTVKKYKFVR